MNNTIDNSQDIVDVSSRRIVQHMSRVVPNRYGGYRTTTLCGRSRLLSDGSNITEHREQVTCKLCLAAFARCN